MTAALGTSLGVLAIFVVGRVVIARRRRWLRAAALQIDQAIQAGGYTYREGFREPDDALRVRTQQRRDHADRIKREGRQIETQDDRSSRIHLAS